MVWLEHEGRHGAGDPQTSMLIRPINTCTPRTGDELRSTLISTSAGLSCYEAAVLETIAVPGALHQAKASSMGQNMMDKFSCYHIVYVVAEQYRTYCCWRRNQPSRPCAPLPPSAHFSPLMEQ